MECCPTNVEVNDMIGAIPNDGPISFFYSDVVRNKNESKSASASSDFSCDLPK